MDVHTLWIMQLKLGCYYNFQNKVETIINKSSVSKISYLGQSIFYF
jgi:hypothetical protein